MTTKVLFKKGNLMQSKAVYMSGNYNIKKTYVQIVMYFSTIT